MKHGIYFAIIEGEVKIVNCVNDIHDNQKKGGLFFLFAEKSGIELHRSQLVSGPYREEDLLAYVVPLGQLARMGLDMSEFLRRGDLIND